MRAGCNRQQFVTLRGGLTIPVEPLLVALDLEARGFRMHPDGDDLLVSQFSRLMADDVRELKRWKHDIITIVKYTADDSHPFMGMH